MGQVRGMEESEFGIDIDTIPISVTTKGVSCVSLFLSLTKTRLVEPSVALLRIENLFYLNALIVNI